MLRTEFQGFTTQPQTLEVTAVKRIWRGLSLAIFLIGVVSFSQVRDSANRSNIQDDGNRSRIGDKAIEVDDVEPAQPFVVKYLESRVSPDGKRVIGGRRTRCVKASGEWRETTYGPDGDEAMLEASKRTVVYGGDADGVYGRNTDSESRRYVSPAADEKMLRFFRSHHSLRNNPEFVRTEEIAGVKAYVLRTEINDPANAKEWVEESFSPRTGFNPLRTIIHLKDGSEVRLEAMSIEFKEVPENLNDDLKALPFKSKDSKKQ